MISILSFDRRALVRASVAVVSVALLAACDSDRALEPTVPSMPTTVQSAVVPTGLGSIVLSSVTIEANVKKLVGGAKFYVFANPTGRYGFYQNRYYTNIGAFQLIALQP